MSGGRAPAPVFVVPEVSSVRRMYELRGGHLFKLRGENRR